MADKLAELMGPPPEMEGVSPEPEMGPEEDTVVAFEDFTNPELPVEARMEALELFIELTQGL